MRILLTNDDGIRAPGIVAMHDALVDAHGRHGGPLLAPRANAGRAPAPLVFTVAPRTVQSATGHGVTFHKPLMAREERVTESMRGVSVDGRPADCVKLALGNIWPERFGAGSRPDLVVSGMNAGANCGINHIYSGTVAAALEAAFLGVPSIAVSLRLGRGRPVFEVAAAWARRTIALLLRGGLPHAHECLSINLPAAEEAWAPGEDRDPGVARPGIDPAGDGPAPDADELPPIRVCAMNTHGLVDAYERRTSPSGEVYYWAAGHGLEFRGTEPGTDVDELMRGCITVTPLMYDLTRHDRIDEWARRLP